MEVCYLLEWLQSQAVSGLLSVDGPEAVTAQAALNRPAYVNSLVAEWLPALPDVLARLAAAHEWPTSAPGWAGRRSSWPRHTRQYASTATTTTTSRSHAPGATLPSTMSPTGSNFEVRDIVEFAAPGSRYDRITFFECLHDLAHPVEALLAVRQALAPGGAVLVVDENVDEMLVDRKSTRLNSSH